MATDKNDAAIVQAIIQMARSLNLQVIAEGVEDERLVALLHGQQCHEAQGYHFARPMAPAAFIDYMTRMDGLSGSTLH
jgi:EAL domain-containing protein (putative c-di-GMP-specific phosphodiesterase class I)